MYGAATRPRPPHRLFFLARLPPIDHRLRHLAHSSCAHFFGASSLRCCVTLMIRYRTAPPGVAAGCELAAVRASPARTSARPATCSSPRGERIPSGMLAPTEEQLRARDTRATSFLLPCNYLASLGSCGSKPSHQPPLSAANPLINNGIRQPMRRLVQETEARRAANSCGRAAPSCGFCETSPARSWCSTAPPDSSPCRGKEVRRRVLRVTVRVRAGLQTDMLGQRED